MIEFKNLTKKRIVFKKFSKLYKKIFDSDFELSVVLAPPLLMLELNKRYRHKKKPADVLAFLFEKGRGEIFINAKLKNLEYLFVHGSLHLKGLDHKNSQSAKIMESKEKEILKK